MRSFIVTHKETGATLLFNYNLNGFLIGFKTDFVVKEATVTYFKEHFPFTVDGLNHYKTLQMFKVDELLQDLSFEAFWNTYAHKVGNKARAEKLWNALSDNARAKALNYIRTYNNYLLQNQGIQKLYPETYLNQKRYNNE